jgi:hypothetical protein
MIPTIIRTHKHPGCTFRPQLAAFDPPGDRLMQLSYTRNSRIVNGGTSCRRRPVDPHALEEPLFPRVFANGPGKFLNVKAKRLVRILNPAATTGALDTLLHAPVVPEPLT